MTEENADLPVEQEQAGNGLDAILDKAMEGFDAPPDKAGSEPEKSAEELRTNAAGRTIGKDGKFVAAESSSTEKPSDGAVSGDKTAVATAPDQAPAPIEVPRNFTAERKAWFAQLDPNMQKHIVDLEKGNEATITRKSQEFAEYRRSADPLLQAVQPFQEYLAKVSPIAGMTPAQLINGLLSAEYQLRTGDPRAKYTAIANIAQTYGVDLAALSRGEISQPDPLISQLRQQVSELTQRFGSIEQQTAQEQHRSLSLHIDSFANAKDEAGRTKYPLFEQVRGAMGQLMAQEKASTLEEAYAEAVKPIQAHIAAELASRQAQSVESNKAALEKARKAAPVKTSGTQPNGATKGKGLDAILSEAMSAAGM